MDRTNATPMFNCSLESRQLADFLIKFAAKRDFAAVVSWEELTKAAGVNVKEKGHVLQTAKRIALREARADFGTVRGVGIKLLDSRGVISEAGENLTGRVRRLTTRGLQRMANVEYDTLEDTDKIRHNTYASFLGVCRMMTNKTSRKRLEGAVSQAQARLPVKETFRLFGAAPNGDE
jgi:hypothetical protein